MAAEFLPVTFTLLLFYSFTHLLFYSFTLLPFYAKQTQFTERQNEHNRLCHKGL